MLLDTSVICSLYHGIHLLGYPNAKWKVRLMSPERTVL